MRQLLFAAVARAYLRKPDQAEFLQARFPDLRSMLGAARNELAFRLGADRLSVLTTLNVELTSRCNVACSYCDVNRGLQRENRDLDLSVLLRLIEDTPGLQTLLPFQWGEPLLYAPLDEALAAARARRVRTYVTTNGLLLDAARFTRLARAGLTRLTVSLDGSPQSHRERRGYAQSAVLARLAEARTVQQRDRLATRLDVSMVVDGTVAHELDDFRARLAPLCDRVQFIPRLVAGTRTTRCREPWRGIMVVLSDGRVTTCCADVRGTLALGRVDRQTGQVQPGTGAHDGALDGPAPLTPTTSRMPATPLTPPQLYASARWRDVRRAHRDRRFPATCARCSECDVPGVSRRFS